MSKPSWTWAAAATATLAGVAAAMLMAGATPARSDDGEDEEEHTLSQDCELVTTVLDRWDSEIPRENALAAYLEAPSREDLLAPVEDPSYLDTH